MFEIKNCSVVAEGKVIVDSVSLTVEEGTVSVLMGPNGSGKSSLVNAIMGHPHYSLTQGEVLLDGEVVHILSVNEKAKKGLFLSLQHSPKIGGVPLATFLHKSYCALYESDMSVLEFYVFMRTKAEEYGINPDLLDRPLTAGLSGGEKKMSDLLQLIALQPKVAFLDEIDSGVDVDAMKKVFTVIDALKKTGMGFLIISHHPSLLDHLTPDKVYVMGKGTLMHSGGEEVAKDILRKGFCSVGSCEHVGICAGGCA
jgi:Fe-S cluster assembly ATP-binding protein